MKHARARNAIERTLVS
ncbi:hypothetical protein RDI58_023183 [Solanum bulbocastanum]|uniref:Uncharacterized protein n=1 Tax=Solanum bulbocastanum TaxID=147425 RepID=A0AAN8Y6E1_SOLBU